MTLSRQRQLAYQIAIFAHNLLLNHHDNPDKEPLDGDQTEELSVMFREELDLLNGNTQTCLFCNEQTAEDLHFQCEHCGVGMCDDCYQNNTEHDGIQSQPIKTSVGI